MTDPNETQREATQEQGGERLPRDGRDTDHEDRGEPPVRDRPGGPGLDGMRVSGPGEVSPAPPDEDEAPRQDGVVEERRQRVQDGPSEGST